MSKHFTAFKANVSTAIGNRQWFLSLGALPLGVALAVFVAIGALLFYLAISGWRSVYPRWSDIVLLGLGVAALVDRGPDLRRPHAAAALAAALEGGGGRGRALGGVPPVPDRLPPAAGGAARDARAVGAAPRLRDRVRDRRARAPGRAHGDARGDGTGLVDLLDLGWREPRHGTDVACDRRSRLGVRLRARPALVGLRRIRRRLLGRRRRRRRRRRRGSAARGSAPPTAASARRARSRQRRRRSATRPPPGRRSWHS